MAEAWAEGSGPGLEAGGWQLLARDWWLEARGQGLGWLVALGWVGLGWAGWLAGWAGFAAIWGHLGPSPAFSSLKDASGFPF